MDLALTKIIKITHANVDQKNVLDILLEKSLDGELEEKLVFDV